MNGRPPRGYRTGSPLITGTWAEGRLPIAAAQFCRQSAISGRLIEHGVGARISLANAATIGILLHLEGIEAGAHQEHELIAQHVAGGAQLAAKAVALPQQSRLAVGAARPGSSGTTRATQRERIEMGREPRPPCGLFGHSTPVGAARRAMVGGIGEEARRRNDHRHVVGDRRVVRGHGHSGLRRRGPDL